ncbi:MAG TPA: cytochrome P450 [Actinophytocola sp.]|uniref:cytochrome P450 n=1 Tax=Actinophytocola sp. TaxID=1872138 RepID=UPI002DB96E30|nr:cytochrome P450 [Actinophytocola sp.]HEU5469273.1 cytochrome P450 [Actinophytocola sp.]
MDKPVADILANMDLYAEDQREHLLDALAVAREESPVLRTEADDGYYVVTRYEDVRTVCAHPEIFSSVQPGLRGVPVRLIPLDVDPPDHRLFREFLNRYFSRSFLLRYEEEIRRIAREAIAAFIDTGEVEFVHGFSVPFSAGSLARIVFATDNADLVSRGVAAVHRAALESTPDSFQAVAVLAVEAMAEVENSPAGREDVLAALTTATVDGRPLSTEERLGIVTTLLLGGLDTTRGMIVNIGYHLATRDDVEPILRAPNWWRGELDEFLRFEPTVSFMARTVTRDTELAGTPLKVGDRIAVHFYAANRDPQRFDRPDELVFGRATNPHLAFGSGIHHCLGRGFARIQLAIAFEELLARATNFHLKPGADIPRRAGVSLNSPAELHLTFDRRGSHR